MRREQRAAGTAPTTHAPAPGTASGVGAGVRAAANRLLTRHDAEPIAANGFRALVAAADSGAVLRAGLDRRAHRHQASAARVARAAAVVFPRPQFPAERAARQGDRIVHRGGQGRSADDRPAFRARLAVPPAGRNRARDPHAPEPARPTRRCRPTSARWRPTSSRRTSIARACSIAPKTLFRQARRHAVRAFGAVAPDLDLRDGEGLAEGDRRDAADGGARQAAVLQGDRANITASSHRPRCCKSDTATATAELERALADASRLRARQC